MFFFVYVFIFFGGYEGASPPYSLWQSIFKEEGGFFAAFAVKGKL